MSSYIYGLSIWSNFLLSIVKRVIWFLVYIRSSCKFDKGFEISEFVMLRETKERIIFRKEDKKLWNITGRNEVRVGGCEKECFRNFGNEICSYWYFRKCWIRFKEN